MKEKLKKWLRETKWLKTAKAQIFMGLATIYGKALLLMTVTWLLSQLTGATTTISNAYHYEEQRKENDAHQDSVNQHQDDVNNMLLKNDSLIFKHLEQSDRKDSIQSKKMDSSLIIQRFLYDKEINKND